MTNDTAVQLTLSVDATNASAIASFAVLLSNNISTRDIAGLTVSTLDGIERVFEILEDHPDCAIGTQERLRMLAQDLIDLAACIDQEANHLRNEVNTQLKNSYDDRP